MPEHGAALKRRRLPVILQQERTECGLACIAMVARYYGRPVELESLRTQSDQGSRGLSLDKLLDVAAGVGLCARPVRLSLSELAGLRRPAILHWRMNHFVVLAAVKRRYAVIHDPASGRRRIDLAELGNDFTGIAIEFSPLAGFVAGTAEAKTGLLALARNIGGLWRYLAVALFLMLVTQILAVVPSIATQVLIDEVVLGQDRTWLYSALAGLAAVMLVTVILEALRSWVSLFAGTRLAIDMTVGLVSHLLSLPVRFVESRHLGDIMSKLGSLAPLRQALTDDGVAAISRAVVLLTTTMVMLLYNQALTLISVAGMCAVTAMAMALAPASRHFGEQVLVHRAAENSSLLETLRGYATVSALAITGVRRNHWQQRFALATTASIRQGKLSIARSAAIGVINTVEQVLVLGIGIGAIHDQALTVGVLFAFLGLRARFAGAAAGLVETIQRFILLKVHVGRLSDLVLAVPAKASPRGGYAGPLRGSLQVRDVGFSYGDGQRVIANVSFTVAPGDHVVITGPSGSGKTTLLKILFGQLQADSGTVLFDGIEVSLLDKAAISGQVGVVMQNDHLFQGSIADNISSFAPVPDLVRVREAARNAAIWDVIGSLPMGVETPIGDSGHALSGGQVQRLILARALYQWPRMLFLDEATSHLDTATEETVLGNLEQLQLTVVSVAHRPAAVRRARQIIKLPGRDQRLPPG